MPHHHCTQHAAGTHSSMCWWISGTGVSIMFCAYKAHAQSSCSFPLPKGWALTKQEEDREWWDLAGSCCYGIMLQHISFPLFLHYVLSTWKTPPLRGVFQSNGLGRNNCVGWTVLVNCISKSCWFNAFLSVCVYVGAIVGRNYFA